MLVWKLRNFAPVFSKRHRGFFVWSAVNLEHPLFVNLPLALTAFSDYPGNSTDRSVFAVIAQYANRRGVAWPTIRHIAAAVGKTAAEVCRSVHRLAEKGFLKISQALKKNDRHPRNIYKIARRFLRRQPDTMSSHYIAEKWKAKAADITDALKKRITRAAGKIQDMAAGFAEKQRKTPPAYCQRQSEEPGYATWRERVATYQAQGLIPQRQRNRPLEATKQSSPTGGTSSERQDAREPITRRLGLSRAQTGSKKVQRRAFPASVRRWLAAKYA